MSAKRYPTPTPRHPMNRNRDVGEIILFIFTVGFMLGFIIGHFS